MTPYISIINHIAVLFNSMYRYIFVLPDVTDPVGGVNVAIQISNLLNELGFTSSTLNGSSDYTYPYFTNNSTRFYYRKLQGIKFLSNSSALYKFPNIIKLLALNRNNNSTSLILQRNDIIIIPEFAYPECSNIFRNNRRILLVQDVFGFCQALERERVAGTEFIRDFQAIVTTSKAARRAVAQFAGRDSLIVSQSVTRPGLDPNHPKIRQIAYMPRKRPQEANLIVSNLKLKKSLRGWEFCRIENVSSKKLDAILNESLIFLSFSSREGFGLPPAEAMAAGCVVVGYTGVGGEEYFQIDKGFPIPDGDIVRFSETVEEIVAEYDGNPQRIDKLRNNAADFVSKEYNISRMRNSVINTWKIIEEGLNCG